MQSHEIHQDSPEESLFLIKCGGSCMVIVCSNPHRGHCISNIFRYLMLSSHIPFQQLLFFNVLPRVKELVACASPCFLISAYTIIYLFP